MKANNAQFEDVLGGQPLAKAWAELEDDDVKRQALETIRALWETRDWWDTPPGRAKKRAKAIYQPAADH